MFLRRVGGELSTLDVERGREATREGGRDGGNEGETEGRRRGGREGRKDGRMEGGDVVKREERVADRRQGCEDRIEENSAMPPAKKKE